MTAARRGELWAVDLGDPIGHEHGFERPALIMSSDQWNEHASVVTVLPLTTTKNGFPTRIEIEPDAHNGLDSTSYARCEDVRSISTQRLVHRIGLVDFMLMQQIGPVLRRFLEI